MARVKVLAPFIGFPSPSLSVWHLFARLGDRFHHVAFMVIGGNRWNEPAGSFEASGSHWDLWGYGYREEDLQRWSEFRP